MSLLSYTHIPPKHGQQRYPKEPAQFPSILILAGKLYKSRCYHTHTYPLSGDSSDIQNGGYAYEFPYSWRKAMLFIPHTPPEREQQQYPQRQLFLCLSLYSHYCANEPYNSWLFCGKRSHAPPEREQQQYPTRQLFLLHQQMLLPTLLFSERKCVGVGVCACVSMCVREREMCVCERESLFSYCTSKCCPQLLFSERQCVCVSVCACVSMCVCV